MLETTHLRLEEESIDSVEAVRSHEGVLVGFSDEMAKKTAELESFLSERLYHHFRTRRMAEKAKRFVVAVFDEYQRAPEQLPPDFRRRLGSEETVRVIGDYVAGMTDRYCQEEYKMLFQPFERM